jgi:carbon storage regulator
MLVLTRKPGEKVRVGDALVIEVAAAERGRVTFAIEDDKPLTLTLMPGDTRIAVGQTASIERKVDDRVVVGADPERQIEVCVVSVKGEAVRVGIAAPRELRVLREEVWREIAAANLAASTAVVLNPDQLRNLLSRRKDDEPA